ncbi:MAG: DUF2270 domain-containing protein [Deltaproteobacteria bacterium]|nr:DUF2270 domain-containing protein [Deltaproteobacteria bacterium]
MSEPATTGESPPRASMVHFYRGELGRMTDYRLRLDRTTNWAVGVNAALLSIAFTQQDHAGLMLVMTVALNLMLVWMEARRFRSYEMIRRRVRLLETGFLRQELGAEPRPGWVEALAEDLQAPQPAIGTLDALSVRLRRNYLWLIIIDYGAWFYLISHADLPTGASIGPLSGVTVITLATTLLVILVGLALRYQQPEEG